MKKTLHLINLQPNVTAHLEPNQPDHSSSTTRRRLSNIRKRSIGFSLPAISTVPGRQHLTDTGTVSYCMPSYWYDTYNPTPRIIHKKSRTHMPIICMQQYQTGISYRTHKEEEKLDTQANKQASKQASKQTSKQTSKQANRGFSPKWRGKKSSRGII